MNTPQTLGSAQRTFVYDPEQRKVTLMVGLGMLGLAVAFPVLYAIDPEAAGGPGTGGNGLGNMRERGAEAGGECTINSRVGHGTTVTFRTKARA